MQGRDAGLGVAAVGLVDWCAEGYDGGNKFGRAVARRVVEGADVVVPFLAGTMHSASVGADLAAGDADGEVHGEAGGGGTENGTEAGGEVELDAALNVVLLGTAEEQWGEEVAERVVCTAEVVEILRRKEVCDFENNFVRNSCEGHGAGDVDGVLGVMLMTCRC